MVEHSLGKGEVGSSILPMGTTQQNPLIFFELAGFFIAQWARWASLATGLQLQPGMLAQRMEMDFREALLR